MPPIDNEPALPEKGKIDYAAFTKGQTPDGQFYELLNRMQSATHSINNVYRELVQVEKRLHDRHDEQQNKEQPALPIDQIKAMDERLLRIERIVERIQSDVEGRDYKEHLTSLQKSLQDAQTTLLDSLPQSISQSESDEASCVLIVLNSLQSSRPLRRGWDSSSSLSSLSRSCWWELTLSTKCDEQTRRRSSYSRLLEPGVARIGGKTDEVFSTLEIYNVQYKSRWKTYELHIEDRFLKTTVVTCYSR